MRFGEQAAGGVRSPGTRQEHQRTAQAQPPSVHGRGERVVGRHRAEGDDVPRSAGPGVAPGHWLGGDDLARDELSRRLSGARVSMLVAYLATGLAVLIGVTIGLVSGYVGGRLDTLLMRLVDIVLSMPFLLIAIVMQRVFDASGIWTICIVLGVLSWTTLARVTRAKTMEAH